MNWSRATHPLFVVALWLVAYCLFTAIMLEHLLSDIEPAPVRFFSKLMAYVGAAGNAGFVLASTTLLAFACGLMLKWLGEPLSVRAVAQQVAGAFWVMVAYAWIMVAVVVTRPPASLTLEEAAEFSRLDPESVMSFGWLNEAQYAVAGLFPTVLLVLLARRCTWSNALIAVAFGMLTTLAVALALVRLAHLHQT